MAKRPEGSEITSPLAEDLMLALMELRKNLLLAFNAVGQPEQHIAAALRNVESLEELVRPDVFSTAMFRPLDFGGGEDVEQRAER